MNKDIEVISKWIKGLIEQNINYSIIHPSFKQEDGMSLEEYIIYEQKQFDDLSDIYDLTSDFSIKVLNKYIIHQNESMIKYGYFIYLINSLNKIVCKMNITLIKEGELFQLGSNDFYSQLVPKYSVSHLLDLESNSVINTEITHFSLAIHSPLIVKNIISRDAETNFFYKGNNFNRDGFYYAQFPVLDDDREDLFNRFYFFYVTLEDKDGNPFIEKRKIFFDIFDEKLIPFTINKNNNTFNIINEHYPVHISYWKNNKNYNIEYPRNFYYFSNMKYVLDNDWTVNFNKIENPI